MITRLAVWSGPRNISTAMMRAWSQRPDTIVCDEPLYAHYLQATGLNHPGRDEVLAAHETDWRAVADWLTSPLADGKTVFYQKHMAHHLLDDIDRRWLDELTHVLLIREPQEMLISLAKVTPHPTLADTGLPQQVELLGRLGNMPVIDAKDVLDDPAGMLLAMCNAVGVPYTDAMLSWPSGPRDTDGVWAPYWYDAVNASTGFQPYKPKDAPVPAELRSLLRECESLYQQLHSRRLAV
ncbi:MAG: hypothetical protein WD934_01185 [Gemmatimonadales bacterium]